MSLAILAGCGAFGLRWLNAILLSKKFESVVVIDPSKVSINNAKILAKNYNHCSIAFVHNINSFNFTSNLNVDLCVIATDASTRVEAVKNIKRISSHCSCWVLEKVLSQSISQLRDLHHVLLGSKVLVNYNYRYQECVINQPEVNHIIVKGGLFDFASNCFHYIDLAEKLFSQKLIFAEGEICVNWKQSAKRPKFQTTTANIYFYSDTEKNNTIQLDWSYPDRSEILFLKNNSVPYFCINESKGKAYYCDENAEDNTSESSLNWLHFSDLANTIISDILNHKSLLPTLTESLNHTEFLMGIMAISMNSKLHVDGENIQISCSRHLISDIYNDIILPIT